jgi:hypothetical protein
MRESALESPQNAQICKSGSRSMPKAEMCSQQVLAEFALFQFISCPPVTLNEMPVR